MTFWKRTGHFLAGKSALAMAWPRSYVFFKWLVLELSFSLSYALLIYSVEIPFPEYGLNDYFDSHPKAMALVAVLIAPPLEELMFRLPLRKNRSYGWSVFFLITIAIGFWDKPMLFYPIVAYIVLVIVFQNYLPARERLFPVIVVSSIVFFGLVHLSNYKMAELQRFHILVLPFFVLPQLFAGIALTVVRLKVSFRHAILLHMATNAFFVGLELVLV